LIVIPRSIIKTINRLKVELDPKAEKEVVKNFRISQKETLISVVYLPCYSAFLTQQVIKNIVIGPIVDNLRSPNENKIFLIMKWKKRALVESLRKNQV